MNFIKSLLSASGDASSKRFWGSILIISGLVKCFFTPDLGIASMLIGTGCSLLWAGAVTKT